MNKTSGERRRPNPQEERQQVRLSDLEAVRQSRSGTFSCRCPSPEHPDRHPSAWFDETGRGQCAACGHRFQVADLDPERADSEAANTDRDVANDDWEVPSEPPPAPVVGAYSDEVRQFVNSRGLSVETLVALGIGETTLNGAPALAYPYNNGKAYKIRSVRDKAFQWEGDSRGCSVFNAAALQFTDTDTPIILTEGEGDAAALVDLGYVRTVSLGHGAGTSPNSVMNEFDDQARVVVALDADKPGRSGARKLARALGEDRAYCMDWSDLLEGLTGHRVRNADANDYLVAGLSAGLSRLELLEHLRAAVNTLVVNCGIGWTTPSTMLEACDALDEAGRLPTGFPLLDEHIGGGLMIGNVNTIMGYTGTGKSEFARHIALHCAEHLGDARVIDVELGGAQIARRTIAQFTDDAVDAKSPRGSARKRFASLERFQVADASEFKEPEELVDRLIAHIKAAKIRRGLVVIDSVQRTAGSSHDLRLDVKRAMQAFERLARTLQAMKLSVGVLVVSEANRPKEGPRKTRMQRIQSGSESRSIEYVSGLLLSVDIPDEDKPDEVRLHVDKTRDGREGTVPALYRRLRPNWGLREERDTSVNDPASGLKRSILEYVQESPGANQTMIRDHVQANASGVRRVLEDLVSDETLTVIRSGNRLSYAVPGCAPDRRSAPQNTLSEITGDPLSGSPEEEEVSHG